MHDANGGTHMGADAYADAPGASASIGNVAPAR